MYGGDVRHKGTIPLNYTVKVSKNVIQSINSQLHRIIFVKMKRTFPVITILISLSLLGLILLQVSWFRNLVEFTRQQFTAKFEFACQMVADELGQAMAASKQPALRWQQESGTFRSEYFFRPNYRGVVADKFSMAQIQQKLRSALQSQKLETIPFEFAILTPNGETELYSFGFENAYRDTVNNQRRVFAIRSYSTFETDPAEMEALVVMTPHFGATVFSSIKWMLAGAILFISSLISSTT